ncbi:MAG: FecR domain-containing protein [Lentisphaeraceae bacterium]|nr:FecR domain-containing protein [Lentisphaeraceae bacterium]
MNEKDFKRYLTLYLDGELEGEEIVRFKEAVEETPAYRHQFQDEVKLHTLLREVVSEKIEERKISKTNPNVSRVRQPRPIPFATYIFSSVAAILIVGFYVGTYFINKPVPFGHCAQVPGEGAHVVMRDTKSIQLTKGLKLLPSDKIISEGAGGILISLNDGSTISLEKDTQVVLLDNEESDISLLKGEVLLEVSKRKVGKGPFKVKTTDSVLTVLGTVFSVKAKEDGFTKLDVYEGRVEVNRLRDSKKVQVTANQSVLSSDENLSIFSIGENKQSKVMTVLPTDDLSVENKRVKNDQYLKVVKSSRVIYLKFDVSGFGAVKKAVLYLTQKEDPGSGTLSFYLGDHTNWTENTRKSQGLPKRSLLLNRQTGSVMNNKTIEVDLSKGIKGDGVYTVIVTLNKSDAHDIWFSSKEGTHPPRLQLTR